MMQNFPLVKWAMRHPRLAAWIVLSLGMVIMLAVVASNVGLAIGQWIALIVACVLVAGLCIWIISWEDEEDGLPDAAEEASVSDPAA